MAITCPYCALDNAFEVIECQRCGATLPTERELLVDEELDQAQCPSCRAINTTSAEYCTSCGTPMAVITRVLDLVNHNERGPLETWRVYGIETQMVARQEALEALQGWQRQTQREGRAAFVALKGETGLGKSRLIAEFHRELDRTFSEALMVPVECQEVTAGAFHMFSRWFKTRFYIAEREPTAVARRKLLEAVEAILGRERAQDVARIAGLVGHVMGLPGEELEEEDAERALAASSSDGALFDRRLFEAVAELLRADAQRNPLVVALEDLQYASDQSLRLLDYLRRHVSEAPILFLLCWNPEELYADTILSNLRFDHTLELGPLSDEDVDAFVRQTLHKVTDLPDSLVEKIVESAHGNPLAVEEMLRLLIGEGTIDTRQEQWHIDEGRIKRLKLPQTVEAAVRARIEALGDQERELLKMACCVGDAFWPDLLVSLWRLRQDADGEGEASGWRGDEDLLHIEALMESLERKDIIRRRDDSTIEGEQELYFKHRLERKTIYNALLSHVKQRYHRLIAQWLDGRLSERERGPMSEYVAAHFDQARSLDRAAARYIEAGDWARKRYANRKAIELYAKGLSYLSDADMELKIRAFHDLGSVHDLIGEYDQSLAYYRELLRYAWLLNAHNKAGVALNKIGRAYRNLSEFDEALGCLRAALEHFQRADDTIGIASTLDDMGKVHWIRANYDEALTHYNAGLALRREQGDKRSIALSLNHIGSLHLQRGEMREAMIYFREALELRRAVDDRQGVAESFNNLGILCMERGDYPQATTLFEEALEIVREIGYRALEGILLNNLGETLLLGDASAHQRASALLEEALEVAEESGEKRLIFDILRNLGQSAVAALDRAQAITYLEEALGVAAELDAPSLIAIGKQSLADIHARHLFDAELGQESRKLADAHYHGAIEILREVGNESQLGRCLSSYGQFLIECGEFVQGKQNLEQAREIFKRLQMRKLWDATERVIEEL